MYVVFQQSLKDAKSYNIAVGERVVVVGGRGISLISRVVAACG